MDVIKFASRTMPHFNFSNFAYWSVELDGIVWKTSEHYYQASKFKKGGDIYEQIRQAKTPADAPSAIS